MAVKFRLRTAKVSDLPCLAAIELESFTDPSWSAPDFLRYDCTVAEIDTRCAGVTVAGFLVSRENYRGTSDTPPEREILNLAVAARFRRLGIASGLLAKELQRGADVFLEVRASNAAAIHLYKNAGFTEIAQRRDYYANPVESGIVMRVKW